MSFFCIAEKQAGFMLLTGEYYTVRKPNAYTGNAQKENTYGTV